MLGEYPDNHRCVVIHAQGDADLLIATTAIRYADTKAVGDDTDVIVLMCYYVDLHSHNLFLHTQSKPRTHTSRLWSMKVLRENLGSQECESMLLIHAISGCDTASRLY